MRQLAALLSFWQNGYASDHFRGGKRGRKREFSKQSCIAHAVRPAVPRGLVGPERRVVRPFCLGQGLSSPLWNVAAQPWGGSAARAGYARPSHYGPEVQHALFLVWHAANRICAKRLIPFLPTLLEALERHQPLHLTEDRRRPLPSIRPATAD